MKVSENGHPTIDEEPTDEMLLAGARAAVDQLYKKANVWTRGYIDQTYQQDWLDAMKHGWKAMEAVKRG